MAKLCCWVFLSLWMPALFGQQAELKRLVAESERLRALTPEERSQFELHDFGKFTRPSWLGLKGLLRDWIETRLPRNSTELDAAFPGLEARLTAELSRAGLIEPDNPPSDTGYVHSVKLLRPAEFPGALIVEAGVSVPCGYDESVYVYRFTATGRDRVLGESGKSKYGDYVIGTQFSAPDAGESHIFYVAWSGVQCASVWNGIAYRLFRIEANGDRAALIFSDTQLYNIGYPVHVKLTPGELLLEFTGYALEPGFHANPRAALLDRCKRRSANRSRRS